VIISDIAQISCDMYQDEKYLGVPVRGYVATSRRFTRKEWEDSILLCSTELEQLTWTKISGGIRCWEQFNSHRVAVNDPQNSADVLAMWGTRSYFDAEGFAWGFHGKLKLPPLTAEHGDVLEMAREAFHAAAGLPNKWPCGMAFFVVHCEFSEMMSAERRGRRECDSDSCPRISKRSYVRPV
jgi:hypothetical protein